jgi:hypothetical protein
MPMEMYLNDSARAFEFVLQGELTGDHVKNLEQAWITATSILNGKDVLVDVSSLAAADAEGVELLERMVASGARLKAGLRRQSEEFLRTLGVPVAALPRRPGRSRVWASAGPD